jgi:hypothetical protein
VGNGGLDTTRDLGECGWSVEDRPTQTETVMCGAKNTFIK